MSYPQEIVGATFCHTLYTSFNYGILDTAWLQGISSTANHDLGLKVLCLTQLKQVIGLPYGVNVECVCSHISLFLWLGLATKYCWTSSSRSAPSTLSIHPQPWPWTLVLYIGLTNYLGHVLLPDTTTFHSQLQVYFNLLHHINKLIIFTPLC